MAVWIVVLRMRISSPTSDIQSTSTRRYCIMREQAIRQSSWPALLRSMGRELWLGYLEVLVLPSEVRPRELLMQHSAIGLVLVQLFQRQALDTHSSSSSIITIRVGSLIMLLAVGATHARDTHRGLAGRHGRRRRVQHAVVQHLVAVQLHVVLPVVHHSGRVIKRVTGPWRECFGAHARGAGANARRAPQPGLPPRSIRVHVGFHLRIVYSSLNGANKFWRDFHGGFPARS